MILDADTDTYAESVNIEVDPLGTVIKTWNMADIISATMVAGGDDPAPSSSRHRPIGFTIMA